MIASIVQSAGIGALNYSSVEHKAGTWDDTNLYSKTVEFTLIGTEGSGFRVYANLSDIGLLSYRNNIKDIYIHPLYYKYSSSDSYNALIVLAPSSINIWGDNLGTIEIYWGGNIGGKVNGKKINVTFYYTK